MGFDVGQKILLRRVISRLQLNSENPTASKPVASEVSLLPGLDLQQELCSIEHSPTLRLPRTLMCPKPCSFTFWLLRFELFFTRKAVVAFRFRLMIMIMIITCYVKRYVHQSTFMPATPYGRVLFLFNTRVLFLFKTSPPPI